VDWFDLIALFRRARHLVAIALVAGLLWAPTPTAALIRGEIDAKAARISGQLMHALRPILHSTLGDNARERRSAHRTTG
jgi:hypothetical protein